jgi:arsenite methyltransferase
MSQQKDGAGRADYGLDAPGALHALAILGVAGILLGTASYLALRQALPQLATVLLNLGAWGGLGSLAATGTMLWSSKVGKLQERDRLVEDIPWQGDEEVLDVGCGRGLLLIAVAKHLTTGKAVGVDIWQSVDQSGNRPEATLKNARIEGVSGRVGIRDGDARLLPFEERVFEVVVSSLTLHNIPDRAGREQAVREIVRVLKPGGLVSILDIARTGEYARVLAESGIIDVRRSRPRFLFSPLARTVTGKKPFTFD